MCHRPTEGPRGGACSFCDQQDDINTRVYYVRRCLDFQPQSNRNQHWQHKTCTNSKYRLVRNINLHVQCINTRSVKNKATSVADLAILHNIDVLALTETKLGSDIDKHVVSQLVPIGYKFHAVSRCKEKRGGGVALMYKAGLQVKNCNNGREIYTLRTLGLLYNFRWCYPQIWGCIASPAIKEERVCQRFVFRRLSAYLDGCMLEPHEIVITGNLNFHLDTDTVPNVRRFSEALADHDMDQYVTDATHNKGHILDVLIVRINGAIIYAPLSVYHRDIRHIVLTNVY